MTSSTSESRKLKKNYYRLLEERNRRQAKASLFNYVCQAWPVIESAPFVANWHVQAICDHLQAVTEGRISKLLINVPPGCSKSLLTSVFWPTWEWISNPATRWLFFSYDQRLATRDSVKCRELIGSNWYQERWGSSVKLKIDENQKTLYGTTAGGYRMASSCPGGHGTGEHPDRIVFDDPHDVTGAESPTERQGVLDWWDLTMPTRGVSRNASRVGIGQRLHEHDLFGHIQQQGGWTVICLPMRYEPDRMPTTPLGWNDPRQVEGELLTPNQFPEVAVAEMEKILGLYGTASQLQQRPSPRTGGMFQRHWFTIVEAAPVGMELVRYWDKAGTRGGGNWTVGVLMGRTAEGAYYVLDVVRGQWSAFERSAVMLATAEGDSMNHGPVRTVLEEEGGSGGKDSSAYDIRNLAGYQIKVNRPATNKTARAQPFADQCEPGNVRLVRGPWVAAYLDELCAFKPYKEDQTDDQVDASSGAFNELALGSKKVLEWW